jgi:hypothetical protein
MALVLAMLVQRFSLAPAPGQAAPEARMAVTLRPAGGLQLVLRTRTPAPAAAPATAQAPQASAQACPFHG